MPLEFACREVDVSIPFIRSFILIYLLTTVKDVDKSLEMSISNLVISSSMMPAKSMRLLSVEYSSFINVTAPLIASGGS